jgi:hypothetical protein
MRAGGEWCAAVPLKSAETTAAPAVARWFCDEQKTRSQQRCARSGQGFNLVRRAADQGVPKGFGRRNLQPLEILAARRFFCFGISKRFD